MMNSIGDHDDHQNNDNNNQGNKPDNETTPGRGGRASGYPNGKYSGKRSRAYYPNNMVRQQWNGVNPGGQPMGFYPYGYVPGNHENCPPPQTTYGFSQGNHSGYPQQFPHPIILPQNVLAQSQQPPQQNQPGCDVQSQNNHLADNNRQSNSNQPPISSNQDLFVNKALLETKNETQIFSNRDNFAYSILPNGDLINGLPQQGTGNNNQPSQSVGEKKEVQAKNSPRKQSDTLVSVSPASFPSWNGAVQQAQAGAPEQPDNRSFQGFTFDGTNFPQIAENESLKKSDAYNTLLADVRKLVENFIQGHLQTIKTPEPVKNVSEEIELNEQPVNTSNRKNEKDQAKIPENSVPQNKKNNGLFKIDELLPLDDVLCREQDKTECRRRFNDIPPLAIVNLPISFEKMFTNPRSEVIFNGDKVSISLNDGDLQVLEAMIREATSVTFLMYANFSGDSHGQSFDSDTRPDSPDENQPGPNEPSSSSSSNPPAAQHNNNPSSRQSDSSNRGETSTPGRSSSHYVHTTRTESDQPCSSHQGPSCQGPSSSSQEPSTSEQRPNPDRIHRRLPEIPAEYRNGARPVPLWVDQEDQENAQNNQPEPQNWDHHQEQMRFIVPEHGEFHARLPFPPYRMPLIGVARRAPGPNYVPTRILPAHENFAAFRRRMQEMRMNDDVGDPDNVRGNGPLMLEPRGFWYPTDDEMEELERRYQDDLAMQQANDAAQPTSSQCVPNDARNYQEGQLPTDQARYTQFKAQLLSEREKERKRREAAQSCQSEASLQKYELDSDDDSDDENMGSYSQPATNSQPTSSRTKHTERATKCTAHKNQKRREKEAQRIKRKEEEKARREAALLKKEEKLAKQIAAEKKRKLEEEALALKKEEEERQRKEVEEQKALEREKMQAEKRKLINKLSKEKKKKAKKIKFEAKKYAEEMEQFEEAVNLDDLSEQELQEVIEKKYLILQENKRKLDEKFHPEIAVNQKEALLAKQENAFKTLCDYEMLDMCPIRERSEKICSYFELDSKFQKDMLQQSLSPEEGRFKVTAGICATREWENMKLYDTTRKIKYLQAVRQYRFWVDNIYSDLSLFINYIVGLAEPKPNDPTIELFEEWAIFSRKNPEPITKETVL